MFGVEMRNNIMSELVKLILLQFNSIFQMYERFEEDRQETRMEARAAIEKAQKEYKKQYDKKRKPEPGYSVGDLVAIKRTQFVAGKNWQANI